MDWNVPLHLLHKHCPQLNYVNWILRYSISTFMVVVFVSSLSHQEMSQLELSRTTDIMTTPTTYINSYVAKAALTKDANESQ